MRCVCRRLAERVALVSAVLLALTLPAWAEKNVALLIGNAKYKHTPRLENPARDVILLKDSLKSAGFDVLEVASDLSKEGLIKALRAFEDMSGGSDIALIYYSGHGMELGGQNYIIPVDARLNSDRDVEDETVSLDRVMRAVEGAARLRLVILDACRNNPFAATMRPGQMTRAVTRGLARIEPSAANTLVAFAAKAGTVALDGEGKNSPFAASLSRHLVEPGLDVRIALGKVRDDVFGLTGGTQEPFVYGSLGGSQISIAKAVPAPVDNPALQADKAAFEAARSVGTPSAYDAFIGRFPGSFYASLARELRDTAVSTDIAPPAPKPTNDKPTVVKLDDVPKPSTSLPAPAREKPAGKPARTPSDRSQAASRKTGAGNCFSVGGRRFCE